MPRNKIVGNVERSGQNTGSTTPAAYASRVGVTSILLSRHSFLVVIPFCVVAYFSFLTRNYQLDDALIYLRYVKNFRDGFGLVYNPGEKFNALTSPLFTYISLASSFLMRNLQVNTIAISSLFFACASILGAKLFSIGRWEGLFTAVVTGSFGYFYSTFGMETPLFLMLIGLSLYLHKIDSKYFIIALALLVITRFEGVFLAAAIAGDYLIRNRKLPQARILASALIICLLPFIFNYFYYGDFLPATASAKIGQGRSGFWEGNYRFLNVTHLIEAYFSNSTFSALFFVISAAYGAVTSLKDRTAIASIIFISALLCFYVFLNLPNYPWYYAPFFYLMLIFACLGIGRLSRNLLLAGKLNSRTLMFFVLCMATIFALTNVVSFKERGRIEAYARIGSWIERNTAANASIATVEIGTVGWYANRNIIDILGLVNKYNAEYISKGDQYAWLSHYQPDYILSHDPIWRFERSTNILERSGAYGPVQGFNFPGYVLLKKTDRYSDVEIANHFREISAKQFAAP